MGESAGKMCVQDTCMETADGLFMGVAEVGDRVCAVHTLDLVVFHSELF